MAVTVPIIINVARQRMMYVLEFFIGRIPFESSPKLQSEAVQLWTVRVDAIFRNYVQLITAPFYRNTSLYTHSLRSYGLLLHWHLEEEERLLYRPVAILLELQFYVHPKSVMP